MMIDLDIPETLKRRLLSKIINITIHSTYYVCFRRFLVMFFAFSFIIIIIIFVNTLSINDIAVNFTLPVIRGCTIVV